MIRWINRVAVVTGASSGIGAACCKDLVAKGMTVVGLARRQNRLEELKTSLPSDQAKRFHWRQCDVGVEQQVMDSFAWIDETLNGADVLINNAGIARKSNLVDEGNAEFLRETIYTNALGICWCTREAFLSMQRRRVNDGHVIIMNSICGHIMPKIGFCVNLYIPSKHACTALTEVLRQEFLIKDTMTKITSISPGLVDTEIFEASGFAKPIEMPFLTPEEIAHVVTYCIQTPPNVQIHELILKPIGVL